MSRSALPASCRVSLSPFRMPPAFSSLSRYVLFGGVLLSLAACADSAPLGPGETSRMIRPSLQSMTTTSYTTDPPLFTATITPTNSNTSLGPIALGTIPNDMLVEIQVTGLLDLYYSTSMHWYNADPALDLRGDYKSAFDAGGYYDYNTYCSGYVWVTFKKPEGGYQGGVSFCDETEPAFKAYKDTYTQLSGARGAGSAYW